jgi:hypothetical protein
MAKKKTRVLLPGGIQGLVHDLQSGTSRYAQRPIVEEVDTDDTTKTEDDAPDSKEKSTKQDASADKGVRTEVTPVDTTPTVKPVAETNDEVRTDGRVDRGEATPKISEKNVDAPASVSEPPMREYHIVKDDSKDSWDLFIDMARQYKSGDGKLATIYIDETLKSVLDRMKYAGTEKLSTSAILSSIVARFIYDHEDEIRKILFSGNLI